MTISAALNQFFSQFGIDAYPAETVPENASMPYLTYESAISYFEGGETTIAVNLYYRTESEKTINDKAQDIANVIRRGGTTIQCDLGSIWIKRGSPFIQSLQDSDNSNKRRLINLDLEYFT